jgi:2,3,4,5-tetrahydropyridine-2,6-dicarboxylate N-succinyltransferase
MLPSQIEQFFDHPPAQYTEEHRRVFESFKSALNCGEVRAAEPDTASKTGWRVNGWVKKGILLGFRMGRVVDMSIDPLRQPFFDKETYPPKALRLANQMRIVPGGSSIRDAAYIGRGVTCMPPMFINAGAYVDEGTMVDSHALIGSCAQVGRNCHISAGAQIGGVLEPIGAMPVIIEDEVMVGGNCGVYEGVVVKRRAVLGSGVILNASTAVYDLVREEIYASTDSSPLVIPEEAVVVPGSRAVSHAAGERWRLSLYAPVIVKYRDSKTDARVQLEALFR